MQGMQTTTAGKFIVVMGGGPGPALAEVAARRGWPMVTVGAAAAALAWLPRADRPLVVVVQAGRPAKECGRLVSTLRGPWWGSKAVVLLIAAEDEPELRAAGPAFCLKPDSDAEQIEAAVDECLRELERPSIEIETNEPALRAGER
jgi:hypothetical protein